MISITRLVHRSFTFLLNRCLLRFIRYTPYGENGSITELTRSSEGKPEKLYAGTCLGLRLIWYRKRGACFNRCILSSITSPVCSLFLRFKRRLRDHILSRDSLYQMLICSLVEVQAYISTITEKCGTSTNMYGAADVAGDCLEQSGDAVIQNVFYNGWKYDLYVRNVFFFAPSRLIAGSAIIAFGTMHDSQIWDWGGLYDWLD